MFLHRTNVLFFASSPVTLPLASIPIREAKKLPYCYRLDLGLVIFVLDSEVLLAN